MQYLRNIIVIFLVFLIFVSCHDNNNLNSSLDARSGLKKTSWPAPLAAQWRSSSSVDAGLPSNLSEDSLVAQSIVVPPVPMFGITYDRNTVFVLGGCPFLLQEFTDEYRGIAIGNTLPEAIEEAIDDLTIDPYISKVNIETMESEVLTLPRRFDTVNYIGAIIAHQNDLVYVVVSAQLFEIDPHTLEIKRSLNLPLPESDQEFAVYNNIAVWPETGDIIIKRTDFSERTDDIFVLVDIGGEDMSIKATTVFDIIGASRLTVVAGNPALLYLAGVTQTLRFAITETGFNYDEEWSETYRTNGDGTQQSGGLIYMGKYDSVVFENNNTAGVGVTAPMLVYSQSTATTAPTLFSDLLGSELRGGAFALGTGDPHKTGIITALDNLNGITTAWQLEDDGALIKLWETDKYITSSGPANAVSQGHLYTDDRVCDNNGENCTLYFVVLDLESGVEIARTEVAGTLPTIGHIFISKNEAFYIATEAGREQGFLTRITTK